MNSKYDISVINGHTPMCKFVNYIKSQNDVDNLQGLPNYDVYGLTYDEVINYLIKKTEIDLDADNLYRNNGDKISYRKAILYVICYIPALIIGVMYMDEDHNSALVLFIVLFLIILPFTIGALHIMFYTKWHNRKIYNAEIEKYLDALSSYIDYLPVKIHRNWDEFIKQGKLCYNQLKESENESKWHIIETRMFTPSEIECVKESRFSTTCGRRDVFVELINGEKCFIGCYGDFNLTDGEDVDLANTKVVVLSNKLGDKILKIKNDI